MNKVIIKNILITGNRNSCKTTLVNKLLEQIDVVYGGFKTVPLKEYPGATTYQMVDICTNKSEPISSWSDNKIIGIETTFNTFANNCLKQALMDKYPLIIMDELGRFERNCNLFLKTVDDVLNSEKIVIAVLKKEPIAYLQTIKERNDVCIFDLDDIYFEEAYQSIYSKLKILLNKGSGKIDKKNI